MFDMKMEGRWYNHKTGHTFTVKDTYFENDQLMIMTTEGQILDYNTFQDYVQVDKVFTPSFGSINNIPQEVAAMVAPAEPAYTAPVVPPAPVVSMEDELIRRIFKKVQEPKINLGIDWKITQKQMDMIDMLDISPDSIVDYYMTSLDINTIREEYKKAIEAILSPEAPKKTKK